MEQATPTLEELNTLIQMSGTINMEIFYWWCIALMVIIHAGFLSYEIGASRLKNVLTAGVKNILAFAFIVPTFYFFGWFIYNGFANGFTLDMEAAAAALPWSGSMGANISDNATGIFWGAFALFAATTASIMSGALIERTRMSAFIVLAIILGSGVWILGAGRHAAARFERAPSNPPLVRHHMRHTSLLSGREGKRARGSRATLD